MTSLRRSVHAPSLAILLTIAGCFALSSSASTPKAVKRVRNPIRGSYAVILKPTIKDEPEFIIDDLAKTHNARLRGYLTPLVKGGHLAMSEAQAQAMLHDPRVESVWEDGQADLATTVTPRSWNLDRSDNRVSPRLDQAYSYCTTGKGVRAYIVDTGVWAAHDEFSNPDPVTGGTRVPLGFDIDTYLLGWPNRSNDPPCNRTSTDPNYAYAGSHGTAVASVLGGRTLGLAPEVTLVPVRVFDCQSRGGLNVIHGLNWIVNENVPASSRRVVNMSFTIALADPADLTKHPVEEAIDGLISRGLSVVVAAGNDNGPTAKHTPARYSPAIVAGGSKGRSPADADSRWNDGPLENPGSNFGETIDLFAPADRVLVAHWTDPTATRPVDDNRWSSGTSFSAPLVAGAVARNLELFFEDNAQMTARLINESTSDVHGLNILDRQGSPNRLLFMYTDCQKRRPSGS